MGRWGNIWRYRPGEERGREGGILSRAGPKNKYWIKYFLKTTMTRQSFNSVLSFFSGARLVKDTYWYHCFTSIGYYRKGKSNSRLK